MGEVLGLGLMGLSVEFGWDAFSSGLVEDLCPFNYVETGLGFFTRRLGGTMHRGLAFALRATMLRVRGIGLPRSRMRREMP